MSSPGQVGSRQMFDINQPLSRRDYVLTGFVLALFKYAVDAFSVYAATGLVWTPLDYLLPLITIRGTKIAEFSVALSLFLFVWTLPFVAIGIVLSVRRARDARISPWLVTLFFAPLLNYVVMATLAIAPGRPAPGAPEPAPPAQPVNSAARATVLGLAAGIGVGLAAVVIGVMGLRTYGVSLFLGTPFLMGAVSGCVASRVHPRRTADLVGLGCLTVTIAALMIAGVALEGIVCIVMALPIAAPLTVLGALVGGAIARLSREPAAGMMILLLVVPLGPAVERRVNRPAPRIVMTAIDVEAAPAAVWRHVVSFSEIPAARSWWFRTGLAYPMRARMDGSGVGAVRWCEFSTGTFREPVTVWDAPHVLAFDVTDQPPPLEEWSPYSRVHAPHLDGFFRTSHGEFRLVELPGGRTRLEGRTWYSLDMAPALYWTTIADTIVHAIHRRVLDHIKVQAEGER
jgi:uncharacterized membrane protein YhaH (DUF805 family)